MIHSGSAAGANRVAEHGDPYAWAVDLGMPFEDLASAALPLVAMGDKSSPSDAITGGRNLNLYLLLCALSQIVADYRHRGLSSPLKVARRVRAFHDGLVESRLGWLESELDRLALEQVATLFGQEGPGEEMTALLKLLSSSRIPARLRRTAMKMPHCFRETDVGIEDCVELARRFHATAPAGVPTRVIGLRTSGSYMGPLVAMTLKVLGRPRISFASLRPGEMLRSETKKLRRLADGPDLVLVVDEGVWSGSSLSATEAALTSTGISRDRIWYGFCRFPGQPVFRDSAKDDASFTWAGFERAQKVFIDDEEASFLKLLADARVARLLNEPESLGALNAQHVTVLGGKWMPPAGLHAGVVGSPQRRSHVKRLIEVVVESPSGRRRKMLLAKGVGLGFFGYQSWLVAQAMKRFVPAPIILRDGFMFSDWVPGETLSESRHPKIETNAAIADYIGERIQALPLEGTAEPPTVSYTAQRRAARILSRGLGKVGGIAQRKVLKELTAAVRPLPQTVVDGRMGPREWLVDTAGRVVKVDYEEHAFDCSDHFVRDAVYDLAQVLATQSPSHADRTRLIRAVEVELGQPSDLHENLLLHALAIGEERRVAATPWLRDLATEADRHDFAAWIAAQDDAQSDAVNAYLARSVSSFPSPSRDRDIWAFDLDGTLETSTLGFPCLTPSGARALDILAVHGQPALLCTGRSFGEVKRRCDQFGLAGGVAEYGGVIWDATRNEMAVLLGEDDKEALRQVASDLSRQDGVFIDPRFGSSIRAYRLVGGQRASLPGHAIDDLLDGLRLRGRFTVLEGWHATDIVDARNDKANGLVTLRDRIPHAAVHAMGDAYTDLPMLQLAETGHAPANAGAEIKSWRGVRITNARAQRGVLEAVRTLIHGKDAECSSCKRCAQESAGAAVLLRLLGLGERGRMGKLRYLADPIVLRLVWPEG